MNSKEGILTGAGAQAGCGPELWLYYLLVSAGITGESTLFLARQDSCHLLPQMEWLTPPLIPKGHPGGVGMGAEDRIGDTVSCLWEG